MPNIPKPILFTLGAAFLIAAGWFIYADRTAVAGKAPAPAASAVKK